MSYQFYVGQDVVCIRADFDPKQRTTIKSELVLDQVYRLRWVGIFNHYLDGEYLGVKVEGIVRGTCPFWGYEDQPYYANRFRPLVSNPMELLRQVGAGLPVQGIEGPVRGTPDGGAEKETKRTKEVV